MDAERPPFNWPRELAVSAAAAAVSAALPTYAWPPKLRHTVNGAMATMTTVGAAWMIRHPGEFKTWRGDPTRAEFADVDARQPSLPVALAIGSVLGLLSFGASAGGMAAERSIHRRLLDRGIRHPRWWMAGAGGLLTLGVALGDHYFEPNGSDDSLPRITES